MKTKGVKKRFALPTPSDLGAFVRAQIVAQQDQPNPIHFTTPDGTKGRVWLASKRNRDGTYSKIIGDDRHWRCHVPAAAKVDHDAKRATASLEDIWNAELDPLRGFRVRLCIEAEKELQILGCGWRIVTCQFRGDKVLLHHNSNVATMKLASFKHLIAANRACRKRSAPDQRAARLLETSEPGPIEA